MAGDRVTPARDEGVGATAGGAELRAWATARLAQEREVVQARVLRMEGDMGSLVAASADSNADDEHDPEGQTIAYERSQLGALTDRSRAHLAEIDAAAERLRAGTYGTCVVCGEPIDRDRLDARPTADACVEHAAARGRARA